MSTLSFEQVLAGARMLPPRERARLIARLAEDLIATPDASSAASTRAADAWEQLNEVRQAFGQAQPVSPSPAEQLDQDRPERDELLMGQQDDDVHA